MWLPNVTKRDVTVDFKTWSMKPSEFKRRMRLRLNPVIKDWMCTCGHESLQAIARRKEEKLLAWAELEYQKAFNDGRFSGLTDIKAHTTNLSTKVMADTTLPPKQSYVTQSSI